jgi:hypothetical protein
MRVLEPEDRDRFTHLAELLPKPLIGPADKVISLLVHPECAIAVSPTLEE